MVCFGLTVELLSSSGLHSHSATQIQEQSVRCLLRGAAALPHFLAGAALAEPNLDRESGIFYSRNRRFHLPKASFQFFDPTGPTELAIDPKSNSFSDDRPTESAP